MTAIVAVLAAWHRSRVWIPASAIGAAALGGEAPRPQQDACGDDASGTRVTLSFELPGDDTGDAQRRALATLAALGYVEIDGLRSEVFVSREGSALVRASVNDRSTIDGTLDVRIESDCL